MGDGSGRSYHLQALGGLTLSCQSEVIGDARRHRLPLQVLTYIAAGGSRGRTRDDVMARFWPELDEARAAHNLSQALYALRREVGAAALLETTHRLVGASDALHFDVAEFEQGCRDGRLAEALASYRGDFLEGIPVRGSAPLSHWVESLRDRLRRLKEDAEHGLTISEMREGRLGAVLARWYERARDEPLDARAIRHAAHALMGMGRRGEALALVQRHVDAAREGGAGSPDPELAALLEGPPHPASGRTPSAASRVRELCALARGLSNSFRTSAMEEALRASERAVSLAPGSVDAWSTRGAVLAMWSGRRTDAAWWRETEEACTRTLALDPANAEARLWLSQLRVRCRRFEEGRRLSASTCSGDGTPYMAMLFHGLVLVSGAVELGDEGELGEGMTWLERAVGQHPQCEAALEPLCELSVWRGKLDDAAKWSRQLQQVRDGGGGDVRFPSVDVAAGWVALAQGDMERAAGIATAALAHLSAADHGYADLFLASAHLLRGDVARWFLRFDEAIHAYESAAQSVQPLLGAWGRSCLAERAALRLAATYAALRMWPESEQVMCDFAQVESRLPPRQFGWLPGANVLSVAVDRAMFAAARDEHRECAHHLRDATRRGFRFSALIRGEPAFAGACRRPEVLDALAAMDSARAATS